MGPSAGPGSPLQPSTASRPPRLSTEIAPSETRAPNRALVASVSSVIGTCWPGVPDEAIVAGQVEFMDAAEFHAEPRTELRNSGR